MPEYILNKIYGYFIYVFLENKFIIACKDGFYWNYYKKKCLNISYCKYAGGVGGV